MAFIRKAARNILRKAPSVIVEFSTPGGEVKPRYPKWDLPRLYAKADASWVLQSIFRVIVQEVKRPGGGNTARFSSKCTKCGSKYQGEYEKCPRCDSTDLVKPNPAQLARAEALNARPNSLRHSWRDIIGSLTYHGLVGDEYYASIGFAELMLREKDEETGEPNGDLTGTGRFIPRELYVEHPMHIKMHVDERGRIAKNKKYFCPNCYPDQFREDQVRDRPGLCQYCGGDLIQTAYTQVIDGEIKNRFTLNQMAHRSPHRVLPYPFGLPRMAAAWEAIWTLESFDDWFFDSYKQGKISKLINFPEYSPDEVKELAIAMREQEARLSVIDAVTGDARASKTTRNVMMASATPIQVFDIFPDPSKMLALDYYMLLIHGLCGIWGAQPIQIAMPEGKGTAQMPFLKIEISNKSVEDIHADLEEIINEQIYPIFGITDYVYRFNSVEKRDEHSDAEVGLMRARTVLLWRQAGFDVFIDEEGRIRVAGNAVGDMNEEKESDDPGDEPGPGGKKRSNSSGNLINRTTTERHPSGPRDSPGSHAIV